MELSLQDLEAAINYWRSLRPAQGDASSLSPEVNVLAKIYAVMIFQGDQTCSIDSLNLTAQQLLQIWHNQKPA